jgi:uncharacterized protein (TIGR03437 family)
MRSNRILFQLVFTAVLVSWAPAHAATFGTVVPTGGTPSDLALDETRGLLYIANFGAARIDVMTLADSTIHTAFNVAPQPGAIAISSDAQYLVAAHYGNATSGAGGNLITVINLGTNTQQTFSTGDPPLGVAFVKTNPALTGPPQTGVALVVTTTSIMTLDPVSGQILVLNTFANLAQTIPVVAPQFPGQIVQTALAASGNGLFVYGIGDAGTGNQIIYFYDAVHNVVSAESYVSSPPLLPRVSVSYDGSYGMVGWSMVTLGGYVPARYPNTVASKTITGHAIDSNHGVIYAQIPDASQPTGPPVASAPASGTTATSPVPALLLMDSDNLTVRDRISIPENMVGHAVLDSAGKVLYAISDSGVMVLPVGSLNSYHRLAAGQEDVLIQSSFCNRSSVNQSFTIADPGGNKTDFVVTASQSGVLVSPAAGTTPATVQVTIDPTVFQNATGTTAVTLSFSSSTAVNQPRPVRVLINNPDVNQRGSVIDVPGILTDILPDPVRNRFYIVRQDKNQVQVYDGGTNKLITTLRTATTPMQMSFTNDNKYLLVAHVDSQLITVYDLDSLQQQPPVVLPGGHYARSIAQSNTALLALVHNEGTGTGTVDTINLATRLGSALPSLGVWQNNVSPLGVLSPTPNGASILLAGPDGTVMSYSADVDSFTAARQDFSALSGDYAASSYNTYVVGNVVFNASLVPVGTLSDSGYTPSGFAFTGQGGYMVAAATSSSPGLIQSVPNVQAAPVRPTPMVEAPRLPTSPTAATGSSAATTSGTGGSGFSTTLINPTTATGSGTGTTGTGTTSANANTAFTRTLAPLSSAGNIIVLTTSGFTVLTNAYDAAVSAPVITSLTSAGDGTTPVAPSGLVSVYGTGMAPINVATSQIPLPTALGQSCVTVNGTPIPLLFVSSQQINAQLPSNVAGNATLAIHTPGGISNNYNFTVSPAAPSIFHSGTAGPATNLPTIVRTDNSQLVTPTNPIHPKDTVVIYLTGMGLTSPLVPDGNPAPPTQLEPAVIAPTVTLGGHGLEVQFGGMVPGEVGVYQINAYVPDGVPQGLSIPLVISQGAASTTLNVRVVD